MDKSQIVRRLAVMALSGGLWLQASSPARAQATERAATAPNLDELVGQPVDIAPSAYQYRADRKAEENPPESWLALMRYANMPLNKPLDVNAPAIKQALCGLLWEEIRPVQTTGTDLGRRGQTPACARGIGHHDPEQPRHRQFVVEQPEAP